jgi:hypothetical protein
MTKRDPSRRTPSTQGGATRAQFLRRGGAALAGALAQLAATGCTDRGSSMPPDDLAEMRKVDPKLVRYREVGRVDTGLREARGIAAGADGTLYAVGDQELRTIQPGGSIASFPVGGDAQCVAAAGDGAVYVGLGDGMAVLDHAGRIAARWPAFGQKSLLTSVAAHKDDVWVADAGARLVYRCDRQGRVGLTLGRKGDPPGYPGLVAPSPHLDVAVAPDGVVHVVNPGMHRVEAYTRDGAPKGFWGAEGDEIGQFCGCCNPTDLAILPDGRFVTSEKGLPRVTVFTADGKLDCVVASAETFAEDAAGLDVAVDANGRVLVLDPKAKAVRIYEAIH